MNLDEIAQAIIRLLANEEYARRLGEQGSKRVVEEFSLEQLDKRVGVLLERREVMTQTHHKMGFSGFVRKMW